MLSIIEFQKECRDRNFYLSPLMIEARRYYNEVFYSQADPAHGMEHVDDVFLTSLDLLNSNINTEFTISHETYTFKEIADSVNKAEGLVLFLACYLHDIYTHESREIHHIMAANYVLRNNDIFLNMLSDSEREVVKYAVLEHRAKINLKPSNPWSVILKLADKGRPDFDKVIDRVIKAQINKVISEPNALGLLMEMSENHLKEKFTLDGYLYKDKNYLACFKEDAIELDRRINELDEETLKMLCFERLSNELDNRRNY